jgi:DNA-binding NtrC family response regulator
MSGTVLVVEDEPFIRLDVASHLEECGFTVLQARDAVEAICVLAVNPQVDVLFTDVRMPGEMDGLYLAKWTMEHHPRVAVLIASGDLSRETAMRELCAARAFTKPYKLEAVSDAVREMLAARKQPPPL